MKLISLLYVLLSLVFLFYLSHPNSEFPAPPAPNLQNFETADVETPLRRGYFTNLTRHEVILHYKNALGFNFLGLRFSPFALNYPPEEAGGIIRDQTRSSFLEELVVPFKSSFFINGFIPSEEKDAIVVSGVEWSQKVTVKYVPSHPLPRLLTGILIVVFIPLLVRFIMIEILDLKKND